VSEDLLRVAEQLLGELEGEFPGGWELDPQVPHPSLSRLSSEGNVLLALLPWGPEGREHVLGYMSGCMAPLCVVGAKEGLTVVGYRSLGAPLAPQSAAINARAVALLGLRCEAESGRVELDPFA
jgi:hypothetical protein